jgi:hypothetical protein
LSCAERQRTSKAPVCRAPSTNARQIMCLYCALCQGARQRLTSVNTANGLLLQTLGNKYCRASVGKRTANTNVCPASIGKRAVNKVETVCKYLSCALRKTNGKERFCRAPDRKCMANIITHGIPSFPVVYAINATKDGSKHCVVWFHEEPSSMYGSRSYRINKSKL